MPRIIVTDEAKGEVLMSEHVQPEHLDSEHSAVQLLERLAWAIEDAKKRETVASRQRKRRPGVTGSTSYLSTRG